MERRIRNATIRPVKWRVNQFEVVIDYTDQTSQTTAAPEGKNAIEAEQNAQALRKELIERGK